MRFLRSRPAFCLKTATRASSEQKRCEVIELNVQKDRIHIVIMIPPKLSVSNYIGIIKGRTAIRVFNRFRKLDQKSCWVAIWGTWELIGYPY
jgi:putative transposase